MSSGKMCNICKKTVTDREVKRKITNN